MSKPKLIVLAFLANPTCTNWIQGLKSLGFKLVVLDWKKTPATSKEIENWGLKNQDIPIFHIWDNFSLDTQEMVEFYLGGAPDMIFSWEGALILKPLRLLKKVYSKATVIHSVNTYPNAVNELTELRMNWRYRTAEPLIDKYVFYSQTQRELFVKNIPNASTKPYLIMIEPFFKQAFTLNNFIDTYTPKLNKVDENPHIIFTGRSSEIWKKYSLLNYMKCQRDVLGSFFKQLVERNIHIYLPSYAELKGIPNLHHYPDFSNQDIFTGKFSQYISQFDAHLLMYNEYNTTMRRWVGSGLATRFAYSLTSTTPLAVTKTSKFVNELWKELPFGFTFSNADELNESLRNKQLLASLRKNMEKVHLSYCFEAQSQNIEEFFCGVKTTKIILNSLVV